MCRRFSSEGQSQSDSFMDWLPWHCNILYARWGALPCDKPRAGLFWFIASIHMAKASASSGSAGNAVTVPAFGDHQPCAAVSCGMTFILT